ncbi:MAG: nucleotide exchange factor GrpE [Acidimicrobiales bacterium]
MTAQGDAGDNAAPVDAHAAAPEAGAAGDPADAAPTAAPTVGGGGRPQGPAAPSAAASRSGAGEGAEPTGLSVERLIDDLERVTAERDSHAEARMRLQAEFENYKKRVAKQQADQLERAAESLVAKLLPVLDAFDAALAHGAEGVEPLHASLVAVLEKEGLEKVPGVDSAFDPNLHEAVIHEAGDGEASVADVMRTGYQWKGRVLRPAMVKVRG